MIFILGLSRDSRNSWKWRVLARSEIGFPRRFMSSGAPLTPLSGSMMRVNTVTPGNVAAMELMAIYTAADQRKQPILLRQTLFREACYHPVAGHPRNDGPFPILGRKPLRVLQRGCLD
jgi:hypothetical protein